MLTIWFKDETFNFKEVKGIQLKNGLARLITEPNDELLEALHKTVGQVKVVHQFTTLGGKERVVLEVNLLNSDTTLELSID